MAETRKESAISTARACRVQLVDESGLGDARLEVAPRARPAGEPGRRPAARCKMAPGAARFGDGAQLWVAGAAHPARTVTRARRAGARGASEHRRGLCLTFRWSSAERRCWSTTSCSG